MAGGYLLYSGATDYAVINRSVKAGSAKSDPVVTPSRLKGFDGQPMDLVASGSAAAHGVIVDAKGTAHVFGRNEAGQCGVTPCVALLAVVRHGVQWDVRWADATSVEEILVAEKLAADKVLQCVLARVAAVLVLLRAVVRAAHAAHDHDVQLP